MKHLTLIAALAATAIANADTLEHKVYASHPFDGSTQTYKLPKFDPSKGRLEKAVVTVYQAPRSLITLYAPFEGSVLYRATSTTKMWLPHHNNVAVERSNIRYHKVNAGVNTLQIRFDGGNTVTSTNLGGYLGHGTFNVDVQAWQELETTVPSSIQVLDGFVMVRVVYHYGVKK